MVASDAFLIYKNTMSLYEIDHPLGQEIELIQSALLAGMLDEDLGLPSHIKLNYQDPISSGDGIGRLIIADWET